MSVRSDITGHGPDPVRTVTGARCPVAALRRPRRPRPRPGGSRGPSGEGAVVIPFPVRRPTGVARAPAVPAGRRTATGAGRPVARRRVASPPGTPRPGGGAGAAVRPLRLTRRGHAVVTAALLLAVAAVLALGAVVSGHLVAAGRAGVDEVVPPGTAVPAPVSRGVPGPGAGR